jgi:hypothetical protein
MNSIKKRLEALEERQAIAGLFPHRIFYGGPRDQS